MKKENQRITLTKRLLKENLLQLMAEKDTKHITISELCAAAELNRSTFYKHYESIADVLLDIEKGVVADLEAIWRESDSGKGWPLNKRVEVSCRYLQEHYDLAKLLLRNGDSNSGFASIMLHTARNYAIYEQELSHVKDEESKRFVVSFIIHGTYHMVRQWVLEGCPKTPEEMGDLVYQVATKGWEKVSGPERSLR